MAGCSAEVAGEHVYIDVPGCNPLDVQLPFAVTSEDAVVRHAKENRQLQIRLKYLPCRQLLQQVGLTAFCVWLDQVYILQAYCDC